MSRPKGSKNKKTSQTKENSNSSVLEQTVQYEKKIYDLEQMLDIAKSFCQNLDFANLLESIVYICMAQMHVLGAEIFVRNLIKDDCFILETERSRTNDIISLPVVDPISDKLLELRDAMTYEELKAAVPESPSFKILDLYNPTLIVPLIQKNHLNGILLLQERIAIEDDVSYTEYERSQMMTIASLASVAINNAALVETSSTDMMTKLRLKYYFFNVLSDAIDTAFLQSQKLSVLMFDIDFFKKFNDTYGHECGDFVLIGVADLIKKSLREADVASRYGGEEFTVMLTNTGRDEAMLVAERIRAAIDEHDFIFNDQHLHVTISVGVSVFDIEKNLVNSPSELVNQADQGLYMSKSNGRNRVTYFEPKK
ncbi:MAG: sensor domain-containing diguanylate cyclase [Treponema sp.]|nr:sensor domain-containing diguanylate cyclase [Treponema sp.]